METVTVEPWPAPFPPPPTDAGGHAGVFQQLAPPPPADAGGHAGVFQQLAPPAQCVVIDRPPPGPALVDLPEGDDRIELLKRAGYAKLLLADGSQRECLIKKLSQFFIGRTSATGGSDFSIGGAAGNQSSAGVQACRLPDLSSFSLFPSAS